MGQASYDRLQEAVAAFLRDRSWPEAATLL
jgi:hypothetical protein